MRLKINYEYWFRFLQVTDDWIADIFSVVKVVLWSRGAHLTKPGWSKPHTHSNPTNLALYGHKITLYRFNQWGFILLQGCSNRSRGLSPPGSLTLTTDFFIGHGVCFGLTIVWWQQRNSYHRMFKRRASSLEDDIVHRCWMRSVLPLCESKSTKL